MKDNILAAASKALQLDSSDKGLDSNVTEPELDSLMRSVYMDGAPPTPPRS